MNDVPETGPEPGKEVSRAIGPAPIVPLIPTTLDEAWKMAKYLSISRVVPSSYPGQPGSDENVAAVFGAIQLGATHRIPPMSSLGSIMVVNGQYRLYGDAILGVVRRSDELEKITEEILGDVPGSDVPISATGDEWPDDLRARVTVQRRGADPVSVEFSVGDAKRARLWGKTGQRGDSAWVTHPLRMLKFRARQFALRDEFGDCLMGLGPSAEEMAALDDLVEMPDGTFAPAGAPQKIEAADPAGDTAAESIREDGIQWQMVQPDGEVAYFDGADVFADTLVAMGDQFKGDDAHAALVNDNEEMLANLRDIRPDLYEQLPATLTTEHWLEREGVLEGDPEPKEELDL